MNLITLPLTKGHVAIIDAADFDKVRNWKWSALERPGRSPYAMRQQNNQTIYLHRFLMDAPDGLEVDHEDGNGLNCRRSNLRIATHQQNMHNYSKWSKPTSSQFKGVAWDRARSKWRASIKVNRRNKFLGRFDSEVAAAVAYNAGAIRFHGQFAKLNLACE